MSGRRTSGYGPPAPAELSAPGSEPENAIAVRILTSAAKDLVEGAFPPLWVRGEVSDFKAHRNGHWYFALRDAEAQVRCVVWSSQQRRIPAMPDDGMQVVAYGQMTVWPARGDLQFAIRAIEAEGDGLWRKGLERTRLRLEKDGLLESSRKRPLPPFPRRIAVITSPDGAALHDIITVARGRSASVEIVLVPAKVQGEGAVESLITAIGRVSRWADADVVIIGRGGGAREDLWAFNDERVARALAACPMPTVSAVGHEVDLTICDLVADVRAATPSAAAELSVPSHREVVARVGALGRRLAAAAQRREDRAIASLRQVQKRLSLVAGRSVERRRGRIESVAGRLQALSPLATLGRGFAVARTSGGATLGSREQMPPDTTFDLWLRDGIVSATAGAGRDLPPGVPESYSPESR